MPDGSTKHFMGKSVTEAVSKYETARDQMLLDAQKQKGGVTYREVSTAYENYITGPGSPLKRGTISSYRKYLPPLLEYFGDMAMGDIDAQMVSNYLEKMKVDGKSLHTLTNARSVLSCVFRYWCANYHGTGNPVQHAAVPAGMKRGKREEPTEEQCDIINAHPEGCGFWAQLFEYTGLRIGEANGLRWEDVDLEANVIHVRRTMPWEKNRPYLETPKTENAYRDVPILSPLRPALEKGKKLHRPEDYVMSGEPEPLSQTQYEWRWAIYCRPLGLSVKQEKRSRINGQPGKERTYYRWKAVVTAHQFRHLYASNLFYAGVPDKVAQKLMGHADIMTTRRIYQQLRDAEDKKFYAQLDAYVKEKSQSRQKVYKI